jgi:hypothetical protein
MVSGPPTAIEGRMINRDDNPVQWALWLDELKEARAHIGMLIDKLSTERGHDES